MTVGKSVRVILFLSSFVLLHQAALMWHQWNERGPRRPSGGRYFFRRVELPVPLFRQNDPRWGRDRLGPTNNTLGAEGCAISSAAMVLASYGIDTDPQRLNRVMSDVGGFTPAGTVQLEAAAAVAPSRVRHAYEGTPSYHLIDSNLAKGNPVIASLRLSSGGAHVVVIAGKDGFDYLVRDPRAAAGHDLFLLREVGGVIEGLGVLEERRASRN